MASSLCAGVDNTFGPHAGHCRGGFDFTLLFEETILTIPITALILLVAPCRIAYLLHKGLPKVTPNYLLHGKIASHVLFAAAQLAALVLWTQPAAVTTKASVATAVLTFVASLFLLPLSYFEHVYSYRPSSALNLFLLFSVLFDATRSRTLWLQGYNRSPAIAVLVATVLKLVLLVLEATEKRRFLKPNFQKLTPETTSGVLSKWIFSWQLPLFRSGYSNQLDVDHLFDLDKHLKSLHLQNSLQSKWNQNSEGGKYSLLLTVVRTLKRPILAVVFPRLCFIAFTFAQPFLISATLAWSEQDSDSNDKNQGYGLIGAWGLVYLGIAVTMGQHQHLTYRAITMVRGQLVSMLYHKATDLSITAADPTAALTLMSADIERIDMGWRTAHEIWANLVEIGVAVFLLERQLGVVCLIPVGTAIFSIVGSIIAVSFVMARQAIWLEAIEKRIAVTSQMLGSMKGVKMCGLTDVLKERIQAMRAEELRISGKFRRLLIWNMGLAYLAPIFGPILTFTAYSLLARADDSGSKLDTNRMFTSLSLFALLQEPLTSFVTSLSSFLGSIGCFVRIQEFLESEARVDNRLVKDGSRCDSSSSSSLPLVSSEKDATVEKSSELLNSLSSNSSIDHAVVIKSGAFGYDVTKEPNLKDLDAEIPIGKFTLLVGPVGSGKTTLLKAILGEVNIMDGSIYVSSAEVAYCDQTPWHMNGTVRDSIIAFSPFDEAWYQQVLEVCALQQDLTQFPKGDRTTIGSKGIVLSGGQSQRISLARALYARKETIVLDDVFSGLDAHTENIVFHNLLGTDGLLRRSRKTVLIASSRSKRLPYADHIISLDGTGIGCEQGSLEKLNSSGGYVSQFSMSCAAQSYTPSKTKDHSNPALEGTNAELALLEEEKDEAGRRTGDMAIYNHYIKAIGWFPTISFIFAICAFIFCQSFPTVWVNWWAAANAKDPNARLGYYLGIYAMLGVLAILFLIISCWQMIVTMVPLSGKTFHWNLLKTVLDAPMSFFAVTDSGVTINRFSQDLQLIDMDLPLAALNTFAAFVLCIAQIGLIASGSYYTAIAFPFLFAALWVIQHVYLRTSRQLRFLDLESKSPLYALFTESVSGLETLRAFGWRSALEKKHQNLLDRSQRPYYLLYSIQRWLTFVLDMFVAGIAILLVILITQLRGVLPSSMIGVSLVNVILFSQNLKLLLMFWTNLETHIGAISRISSFTANTASEHLPEEKETPPSTWPSTGDVAFENVSAGYSDNENVLNNVTLSIKSGQKVGICGRTGSGKSSMVSCLFRMIDLHGGRIMVDGLDIATLPREEVRTKIIGVPQDTFLINGSNVRFNADPSQGLSDAEIETALRTVELWGIVSEKGGLDAPIEDLHLSHGQKQLFCIARAMLRPSPIVVLDEATSSVDSQTDQLIQRVMKEKFSSHTVISVVHKLETVVEDFDMVALLDAGELREFGSPKELLQEGPEHSAFAALYQTIGAKSDLAEIKDDISTDLRASPERRLSDST